MADVKTNAGRGNPPQPAKFAMMRLSEVRAFLT